MTPVVFDLLVSVVAACVMLALVVITSTAPRRLRLGIASATSVVLASLSATVLATAGEPILMRWHADVLQSIKVLAISWASLDVARIAMRIGTMDPIIAANSARGFLISGPAIRSIWSAWAACVPVPAWVKGTSGQMLAVNASYESRYGKSEAVYVGSRDAEVWPDNTAKEFGENDQFVCATLRPHIFEEPAPTWKQPNRTGQFLKFPVLDSKGRLIGVGGIEVENHQEGCP